MSDYVQQDPEKTIVQRAEDKPPAYEPELVGWAEQQDAPNLVPYFLETEAGRKWLGKLAGQVVDDFNRDWSSSEEYREQRKRNYQLFTGFLPPKDFPFPGCANANTPLMMERVLRLSGNVFIEVYQDRDTIFSVQPTGPDDYERAEILSLHGNWQLKNEITDFLRQQERALQEFFASGSFFVHSYYDPIQRRNRHDTLNCEEFVIPYVWVTNMVDLSDVPHKTRVIRKYRHELEDLRDGDPMHAWAQVDLVLSKGPPAWDVLETKVRDQSAKQEGIVAPANDPTAPFVFYEYHGWYRMPGDKSARPICATVDMKEKTVMRLYLREEEDWRDRMRFDGQVEEAQQYATATQEQQQLQMQQQELQMRLQQPDIDPVERDMLSEAMAAEPAPMAPEPPPWFTDAQAFDEAGAPQPMPVRRVPIEPFTHGICIDNPLGALGLSFGTILGQQNRLVNEALNRYYDAATLNNIQCYMVPEGLDLGTQSLALTPGKIFRVKGVSGEQLKNQIMELRAGPPSTGLLDIVRIAQDASDAAVAAPGVLSGQPGKSGETFRGISTRMEKASRQLSSATIRYINAVDQVVLNNARLNSIFLPEHELISVGNNFASIRQATLGQQKVAVGREMYRRSYSVTFTADVRFTSQAQRVAEAQEVVQMAASLPPLQANPAFLYESISELLRAMGKQNLIPALGPRPAPPEFPMGMAPPPMPGGPPGAAPPGGEPPPEEGQPAGVPLPPGVTGGIQGPRPEMEQEVQ